MQQGIQNQGNSLKKFLELMAWGISLQSNRFSSLSQNALQVHQRTHGDVRPYVCQFCSRGFREKGSLVRHIRHHTGEKPFKCPKCARGFAEHGTLNRHMRAKGQDDTQSLTDLCTGSTDANSPVNTTCIYTRRLP